MDIWTLKAYVSLSDSRTGLRLLEAFVYMLGNESGSSGKDPVVINWIFSRPNRCIFDKTICDGGSVKKNRCFIRQSWLHSSEKTIQQGLYAALKIKVTKQDSLSLFVLFQVLFFVCFLLLSPIPMRNFSSAVRRTLECIMICSSPNIFCWDWLCLSPVAG